MLRLDGVEKHLLFRQMQNQSGHKVGPYSTRFWLYRVLEMLAFIRCAICVGPEQPALGFLNGTVLFLIQMGLIQKSWRTGKMSMERSLVSPRQNHIMV